ncbi:hypothetical protein Tco_0891305 [Tanacetum coccineum]|uniref:Uncharacterized protein n=1 Tax=Tanacetum coccineum TaxID=301880 RepID=A0ABQ5C431_9ASTR
MAQMRAAAPSTYHPLLLSGTPPLLPIPLPAPSTSRRADIPKADTPPQKRLLLTAPRPGSVRAEIEVLRRERLAYKQESIQTRQDLARFEAYSRALEARVTVLDTDKCTDISKIIRKSSKTGKQRHEERKSTKEARDAKPKAGKVKKVKAISTLAIIELPSDLTAKNDLPIIKELYGHD